MYINSTSYKKICTISTAIFFSLNIATNTWTEIATHLSFSHEIDHNKNAEVNMYCNERGTSIHLRDQVKRQRKTCIYVGNCSCDWQLIVTACDYNEISKVVIASCVTRISLASLILLSKGRTPRRIDASSKASCLRRRHGCGYSAPVRRHTHATIELCDLRADKNDGTIYSYISIQCDAGRKKKNFVRIVTNRPDRKINNYR